MSVQRLLKSLLETANYVYTDRSALAASIVLAALILVSLVGPLVYSVDPYSTSTEHVVRVVRTGLESLETSTVATARALPLRDAVVAGGLVYAVGYDGGLYRLSLGSERPGEPVLVARGVVSITVYRDNVYVLYVHDDRYLVGLVERETGVLRPLAVLGTGPSSPALLAVSESYVAVASREGGLVVIERGTGRAEVFSLGFSPNTVAICGQRAVAGGPGGRVSLIDLVDGVSRQLRPFIDDVLYLYCLGDRVYVLGRIGSLAIVYEDYTYREVSTGVLEDLVYAVYTGDRVVVVGARGSLIMLDGGSATIHRIRGVENVRRAYYDGTYLYVISVGERVRALEPPSPEHPLGTDYYGRDLMAQVMVGVRSSLLIAFVTAVIVVLIGGTLGLLAGYFRGPVDSVINSVINFMYSIPLEPFAILLAMVMRPGTATVILAISLLIWRTTARIIRSQVISVSSTLMIESARAIGAPHVRVIYRYILPAVLPIMLLDFASVMVYAILAEATLSFLGVGPQDTFTLGTILNHARVTGAWRIGWWLLVPGLLVGVIALSLYTLIRAFEPLANPRLRRL